jgi:hypothetical protein
MLVVAMMVDTMAEEEATHMTERANSSYKIAIYI